MSERKKDYRTRTNPDGSAMRSSRTGKPIRYIVGDTEDKGKLPQTEFPVVNPNTDTTQDPKYSEEAVKLKVEKYTFGGMVVDELKDSIQGWKLNRAAIEAARCLEHIETGHAIQQVEAKLTLIKKYPGVWATYNASKETVKEELVYEPG